MSRYFYGIDPGANGAIAVISEDRSTYGVWDSDKELPLLAEAFSQAWLFPFGPNVQRFAAIEKVSVMPKQGIVSGFNFGMNYGAWIALLCHEQIPFQFVTPRKWQQAVFDSADKHSKSRSLELARRLFPDVDLRLQKHEGRAESLLIAEYARRTMK